MNDPAEFALKWLDRMAAGLTITTGIGCVLQVCWLLGCAHLPVEPAEPVEPPQAREACEAFCEVRVSLECEDTGDSPGPDEVDGTADDVPCVDVCRDIVTQGQYDPIRECLDHAATCEAAETCIFGAETGPELGP